MYSIAPVQWLKQWDNSAELVAAGSKMARDLDNSRAAGIAQSLLVPSPHLGGPPGTGKTLLASVLARSAGLPLPTGSLAE